MVRLSVNVNKVATLRTPRRRVAERGRSRRHGGRGRCARHHAPRPDERHIRRQDVLELAAVTPGLGVSQRRGYPSTEFLTSFFASAPPNARWYRSARRPDLERGLAAWPADAAAACAQRLRAAGVRSSLFLDTNPTRCAAPASSVPTASSSTPNAMRVAIPAPSAKRCSASTRGGAGGGGSRFGRQRRTRSQSREPAVDGASCRLRRSRSGMP